MVTIQKAIRWWEGELTSEERSELIPESWSEIGENTSEGIAKRHRRLIKAYQEYHKAKQRKSTAFLHKHKCLGILPNFI